jgi:hypothetical protein
MTHVNVREIKKCEACQNKVMYTIECIKKKTKNLLSIKIINRNEGMRTQAI